LTQVNAGGWSWALGLDIQKILVRSNVPEAPTFPDAQWGDSLPKLLQPRIVQTVLTGETAGTKAPHYCVLEREPD